MANPMVLNITVLEKLETPGEPRNGFQFDITLIANNRDHSGECGAAAITALRDSLNRHLDAFLTTTDENERHQYVSDVENMKVEEDTFATRSGASIADVLATLIG